MPLATEDHLFIGNPHLIRNGMDDYKLVFRAMSLYIQLFFMSCVSVLKPKHRGIKVKIMVMGAHDLPNLI